MRFDPFENVSCRYGAPMGRSSSNCFFPEIKLCARHQGGGEGYDKGGAYWGTPSNVWAVWLHGKGPDTVQYIRADCRSHAIEAALNHM